MRARGTIAGAREHSCPGEVQDCSALNKRVDGCFAASSADTTQIIPSVYRHTSKMSQQPPTPSTRRIDGQNAAPLQEMTHA